VNHFMDSNSGAERNGLDNGAKDIHYAYYHQYEPLPTPDRNQDYLNMPLQRTYSEFRRVIGSADEMDQYMRLLRIAEAAEVTLVDRRGGRERWMAAGRADDAIHKYLHPMPTCGHADWAGFPARPH
jgi:hypothetical protein